MVALIDQLRAQIDGPRDGALLRFSLGNALLAANQTAAAIVALRQALEFDADYSAAWKLLGKALEADKQSHAAMAAYAEGMAAAERRGDVQAGKEMRVFLRRLQRDQGVL